MVSFRYLAATDGSPMGRLALEWLPTLLRIGMVRVATLTGEYVGGWERYTDLMTSPIGDAWVNVVCAPVSRWTWVQHIPVGNPDGTESAALERVELWTAGVKNVLLAGWEVPSDHHQADTVCKYDLIITEPGDPRMFDSDDCDRWMAAGRRLGPPLLHLGIGRLAAWRPSHPSARDALVRIAGRPQ